MKALTPKRSLLLLTLLLVSKLCLAQEGEAGFGYSESLARDLKALTWEGAERMSWRHWSGSEGVSHFSDSNKGKMRARDMAYMKGNPSADNVQIAGPGFYIANDLRSSGMYGEELLDVRLSKKAQVIDLTSPEKIARVQEILARHGVPYEVTGPKSLRSYQLLDILTAHGVGGARFNRGDRGWSWVNIWDHQSIDNLRRGSSSIHVEMWRDAAERLASNPNNDPVKEFNKSAALKKLGGLGYATNSEIRAFAEMQKLLARNPSAENIRTFIESQGLKLNTGAEAGVEIRRNAVTINAPENARAHTLAQLFLQANVVNSLHSANANAAKQAFGVTDAQKNSAAEFLRQNTELRALRMSEALFAEKPRILAELTEQRSTVERRAADARYELVEIERFREGLKTKSQVELPKTHAEKLAESFPKTFDLKRFHVEPQTHFEAFRESRQQFSRQSWVQTVRNNAQNQRPIFDNVQRPNSIFAEVSEAGLYSGYRNYNVGPDASRAQVEKFTDKIARYGATIERVPAGDPRLPANAQAKTVITADGQIRVLLPAAWPVKSFALVDELTHVIQYRNMAQASSIAEVQELFRRAQAGDRLAKETLLEWELKAKRNVLLTLPANDPQRKTVERAIQELKATRDPYAFMRRGNGTIDWKQVGKSQVAGLGHFTLALFLKELAVVVETGDRYAIEEFFDGLLTTDFYINYGLFVAGAQAANVAYTHAMERHLNRFIRPRFINSVIKSNVVLAAGMALPQIVHGEFEGKAFAIELAGLGLSTLAVKSGMASVSFALSLEKLGVGAKLAKRLGQMSKLKKVGGWFYTAVELAVILYFGEKISHAIETQLARRQSEGQLKEAIARFRADIQKPNLTEEDLRQILGRLDSAFGEYRNDLYGPIKAVEAELLAKLEKISGKVGSHSAAIAYYNQLLETDPETFGKIRHIAEQARKNFESEHQQQIDQAFADYDQQRSDFVKQIYKDNYEDVNVDPNSAEQQRRFKQFLRTEDRDLDFFSRYLHNRAVRRFESQLSDPSRNRLETYDDHLALLQLAANTVTAPLAERLLNEHVMNTRELKHRDMAMVLGEGPLAGQSQQQTTVTGTADSLGLVRALARATQRDSKSAPGTK